MYNVSIEFDHTLLFDVRFKIIQNRFDHFVAAISRSYHQRRKRLAILFYYLLKFCQGKPRRWKKTKNKHNQYSIQRPIECNKIQTIKHEKNGREINIGSREKNESEIDQYQCQVQNYNKFLFCFAATAFEPRTECELPLDLDYLIVFCQSSDVNSLSLAPSIIAFLLSKYTYMYTNEIKMELFKVETRNEERN